MSSVRVTSCERDRDSDRGSPAPRIRVGYIPHGDNQDARSTRSLKFPVSQAVLQRLQHSNMSTRSSSPISSSTTMMPHIPLSMRKKEFIVQEIDHHLNSIGGLLTETVLLPMETPVDPAFFLSLGFLELYDQNQRVCVQNLRDERKRLLERRQGIELEMIKLETAEINVMAEEKRLQQLELATEATGLAPETLAPMSTSRVNLLDDLGTILTKLRTLIETVHLHRRQLQKQHNVMNGKQDGLPATINMAMFQKYGVMDLYDQDPSQCLILLRVEHARLAARRDDLELEYERQRTALLRSLHSTL